MKRGPSKLNLRNCKRDVLLKTVESIQNVNDELAGMRPIPGMLLRWRTRRK